MLTWRHPLLPPRNLVTKVILYFLGEQISFEICGATSFMQRLHDSNLGSVAPSRLAFANECNMDDQNFVVS